MKRWPDHKYDISHTEPQGMEQLGPWKTWYIIMHKKMSTEIFNDLCEVKEQLERYRFLEFGFYRHAATILRYLKVGFGDICMLLFKRELHVILNLIGLHYSFFYPQVSAEELRNALAFYQVLDRELLVEWVQEVAINGSRMPKERYSLVLSLAEITEWGGGYSLLPSKWWL